MSQLYGEQISNPFIDSSLREWREHGGRHRLEGTQCRDCESYYFPRRSVCPKCHRKNVMNYKFKGEGTIENVIVNGIPQLAVIGYGEHVPRFIATVRLNEGPVVVTEIIDVVDKSRLVHGAKVKMVLRKHARSMNLNWRYAYKFVLV